MLLISSAAPPAVVRLAAVTPDDHRYLYDLATAWPDCYRFRFAALPRYEAFVDGLDAGVLTQFVVRRGPDDAPVGHVLSYRADRANRHAYVTAVVDPAVVGQGLGTAAMTAFVDHLWRRWDLDKLYVEVPGFVDRALAGRLREPLRLEARFRDHLTHDGRRWDLLVYALDRP